VLDRLQLDRVQGLWNRLTTYPIWEVAVEFSVIWMVAYLIVRFVQGTRAAGALKGLLMVLLVVTILSRLLAGGGSFERLGLLFDKFLAFVAVALIVIFQPELRRALVRLGETSFLRSTPKDIIHIVDEVCDAARYLSRSRFGALIVLERQTKLAGLVEGGTRLRAELSSRLLQTIFFPGSALHDLACIINGRLIEAAGVQLPLADPHDMPDASLGSRHRAAVGVTQECDAVVVVVSEETGYIRLAERGRLSLPLSESQLKEELTRRLTRSLKKRGAAPTEEHDTIPEKTDAPQEERAESHDSRMGDTAMGETMMNEALSGESAAGMPSVDPARESR
jgi:diadenylate cyclase